ncbi:hypothetical protein [Pseudomonas sp. TMP25]|uniref:hypothetical protein n=1 Tax=Pseudomonas sp. TMP25 TaxID=3136561 RepID=UPI003100AA26
MPSPSDGFFMLDKLERWGVTRHGLARTSPTPQLFIDGTPWPMSGKEVAAVFDFSGTARRVELGNTHLIKMPGVPELGMSPELLLSERAAGRVWQNYALISGQKMALHGSPLSGGWVYIDDAGERWLVSPTSGAQPNAGRLTAGSAVNMTFAVRPYGYLGENTAGPVSVSASLGSMQQSNPPGLSAPNGASVDLRLASIDSAGRRLIIALMPATPTEEPRSLPYGFLLLTLSGLGPSFTASLTVLRSRVQALGVRVTPPPGAITFFSIRPIFTAISHGPGAGTWEITGYTKSPSTGPQVTTINRWVEGVTQDETKTVTGRIIGIVFDDAGALVELTADYASRSIDKIDEPIFKFTGSVSATGSGESAGNQSPSRPVGSFTGSITVDIELAVNYSNDTSITLRRNGSAFSVYRFTGDTAATQSDQIILGSQTSGDINQTYLRELVRYEFASGAVPFAFGIGAERFEATDYIPESQYTTTREIGFDGSSPIYTETAVGRKAGPSEPVAPITQFVDLNWTVETSPYLRYDYAVQRLSNNLWAPRWERYTSASVRDYAKSPHTFSPNGQTTNGLAGSDWLDRARIIGSYHPITHEIHTTYNWTASSRTDGCWI